MNAMKQVIAKLETELHEKSTNNSFLEAEIRTMQRKLQMKDAEINRQSTELHKLRVKPSQCLKITEKVPIQHCERSELRLYILSGQKFIKNAKNGHFWRVFENLKFQVKQCYQTDHFH